MAPFARLALALASFLLLAGQASARSYPDLPAGHKHYQAVMDLTEKGIVQGYPDGRFGPERTLNRAEAVKMLVGAQFDPSTIASALDHHRMNRHRYAAFPDVLLKEWFAPFVEVSRQNRIIQGYPDGLFRPASSINFAEALKVILESHGVEEGSATFRQNPLLLVQRGEWFEPYFSYAYEHNLISQSKFYHPGQLITRGEFAEVIHRLQSIQQSGLPQYIEPFPASSDEYTVTIPKLGIIGLKVSFADLYNEKGALSILKDGLGSYLSRPGQGKKTILFGHSSSYSWDKSPYTTILRQINRLADGDMIYVNYREKGYAYKIYKSEIIPASQDKKLLENRSENEIALYTCWPPDSIRERYVVYAKPVE